MCACEPGFRCSRCRADDERDVAILMEWSPSEVAEHRRYLAAYESPQERDSDGRES